MVVDFSKIDLHEKPVLILKNVAGSPIGVLGAAINVTADIKYNESSVLEFNLPEFVDGIKTDHYDSVVGMRTIELQDIGQFILVNPKETGDGVKQIKACKAYSLEFEFTFKKIMLENGTYNLWNPAAPGGTILGLIIEQMPSWSVGTVDSSLIGKYRTFEVNNENIYNFMKSTLQKSYSCIFDFDTFNRRINVKDVSSNVPVNQIYISFDNLAKEISVEEDTESIVTRLDVSGADGVTIRDVNPTGTNKIVNLDYYMSTDNFDQTIINKYKDWKRIYTSYQSTYYNLSIEYALQIMRKTTESAKLVDLQGELTTLENQQAVIIQAIAQNLSSQAELDAINLQIKEKNTEISAKKKEIDEIDSNAQSIYKQLQNINAETDFQSFFSEDEYLLIDRFLKDDAVSESSFVFQTADTYSDEDIGNTIDGKRISITGTTVTPVDFVDSKEIYEFNGGNLSISGIVSAKAIHGALDYNTVDKSFVLTAYLSDGSTDGNSFPTACVSITGTLTSLTHQTTSLSASVRIGFLYLTRDTTEYERRSVAWDLFDYGMDILEKISQPSYTFSVTSANFLSLDDFVRFKNELRHGEKLYINISENKTLQPIVIGAKIDWDNLQSLVLEFSDKYISGDSAFRLADLLEQSVSMGKSVDLSKFTYSAFVDSGANTKVKDFMTSALDVAKNAILSSKDQAITWGDSGIRLRKWANAEHTAYEPQQVWMNNNSIMMTSNDWSTAEIAIGYFHDTNLGNCWGIVAPNIVGTLLAGNNLVIESAKKDGGTSVFRVDADGCVLYNSSFDIVSKNKKTQISLDPQYGIVIGDYPVYSVSGTSKTVDESKSRFWVDTNGNLYFKGTLKATNGEFDGKVTAREGYIGNGSTGWTIGNTYIYNGKNSYSSNTQGIYIGTDGISLGDGTHYVRASKAGLLSANNVNLTGTIYATAGEIGGCSIIDGTLSVGNANIQSGISASKITTGTLDASRVTVTNLNASNITSGTLDATKVTVKNLRADSITVGKLTASQIDGLPAGQITSGQFATARIPNLSASKITTGTMSADRIYGGTIDADNVTIKNLTVTTAQVTGNLSASRVTGGTLSGCSISIGDTFYVSSTGLVSMKAGMVRVYSTENVGTYGVGYHYGQTFDMYCVCNTFLGIATSGINLVFVSGICCGYYA